MTTVFFAGSEDIDHFQVGGGAVVTTAARFRAPYSRCAMGMFGSSGTIYWQNAIVFATSSFWFSCQYNQGSSGLTTNTYGIHFIDSSNVVRLRLRAASTSTLVVEKITASGVATQLGSAFTYTPTTSSPDKWDINLVNNASGSIVIYINGISVFTFSGDTTTDGVTSIASYRLSGLNTSNNCAYSEIMVLDADTRNLSLQTFAPSANGNTHNFDTGSPAAANVNETTLNDATLDGSTTAGQIDQYTTGAVATGTFSVVAYGVSARATKGASGPTKIDLSVRTGGMDYFSSDKAQDTAWQANQNWWVNNPNTSVLWQTSEIGAASGFNIGVKSVV